MLLTLPLLHGILTILLLPSENNIALKRTKASLAEEDYMKWLDTFRKKIFYSYLMVSYVNRIFKKCNKNECKVYS